MKKMTWKPRILKFNMSDFTHNGEDYYFLHIPKTGGTTIRHLLRPLASWNNIYHAPLVKKPEAYTFTTIRNPLDRLVSAFFFLSQGGMCKRDKLEVENFRICGSFDKFVHRMNSDPEYYFVQRHLRPMMRYINNVEYIDRFITFDNLERDTISLYKMITGRDLETIPHENKSKHQHFEAYYTEKTRKIVENIYSEDVELYQKVLTNF